MTGAPLPIALTMGEPAGIGGELSIKAWYRHRRNLTPFYLLDDPDRITALSEAMGTPIAAGVISEPAEAAAIFPDRLPVLPVSLSAPVVSGQLNAANIAAVQTSIEIAVRHVEVTNPIHKEALYNAGFAHPGHTEFLAALAGLQSEPVMMLATEALRVATVTRHISLANALKRLSPELIIETVATVHLSLCRDLPCPIRASRWRPSTPIPARAAPWDWKRPRSSFPPSRPCRRAASWSPARIPPTPCFTKKRAPGMTPPFACITTRR